MGTHSFIKRRNASIIAFGSAFKRSVKRARSTLGIPVEGFSREEANKWYEKHHTENSREPLRPMPHYYWHFPKEFVELLDSLSYSSEPSRVNFYKDVPLDGCAMDLIHEFDLPEDLVVEVKRTILLKHSSTLGIGPAIQLIRVPVNEGVEGNKYMALIAGIDIATTKKDWLEIWEKIKVIQRLSGMVDIPYKRPVEKLMIQDLTFWKEIKEGKTAREVIDRWIEKHPEDANLGEDTVRKAFERIDKIMRRQGQKRQEENEL